MESKIAFGGAYTQEQIERAVQLANQPGRGQWLIRVVLAALVLGLAGWYLYDLLTAGSFTLARFVRFLLPVAVLAFFLSVPVILTRRASRQIWAQAEQTGTVRGWLDEEGVTFGADEADQVLWEQYDRGRAEADLIVLVTHTGLMTALPRTFFASEADWQQARALATGQVRLVEENKVDQ
jgi:hypothetical protein